MALDARARSMLAAVDRLTRNTYGDTDGAAVFDEMRRRGVQLRENHVLLDLTVCFESGTTSTSRT